MIKTASRGGGEKDSVAISSLTHYFKGDPGESQTSRRKGGRKTTKSQKFKKREESAALDKDSNFNALNNRERLSGARRKDITKEENRKT